MLSLYIIAGTTGSVLMREVTLFQRSLMERFHVLHTNAMMCTDLLH